MDREVTTGSGCATRPGSGAQVPFTVVDLAAGLGAAALGGFCCLHGLSESRRLHLRLSGREMRNGKYPGVQVPREISSKFGRSGAWTPISRAD
jgi:hypothetical protein